MLNTEQKLLIMIFRLLNTNTAKANNLFQLLNPLDFDNCFYRKVFISLKDIHYQNDLSQFLPDQILTATFEYLQTNFHTTKPTLQKLSFLTIKELFDLSIKNLKINQNETKLLTQIKSILNQTPKSKDQYDEIINTQNIINQIRTKIQEIPTQELTSHSISESIKLNKDLISTEPISKENLENQRFFFSKHFNLLNTLKAFKKKQIITLGGGTGLGKTAFIYNLIYDLLLHQNTIEKPLEADIFSLEMTSEENTARFLSLVSKIPISTLYDKNEEIIDHNQYENIITNTQNLLQTLNINFIYPENPNLNTIINHIRTKYLTNDLNLVVIDHLQLVKTDKNQENDRLTIDEIMTKLKQLAIELDLVIIILSQFSRESYKDKQPPNIASLKGSGGIETNSDLVMTINEFEPYWDNKDQELKAITLTESGNDLYYNAHNNENHKIIELTVHKNRSGKLQKIIYLFNQETVNFQELGTVSFKPKTEQ